MKEYSVNEFKDIVCNYVLKHSVKISRANLSKIITLAVEDYETTKRQSFSSILDCPGDVATLVASVSGANYYISLPAESNGSYHVYVSGTCSVFTMHETKEEILTILSDAYCIKKLNSRNEEILD